MKVQDAFTGVTEKSDFKIMRDCQSILIGIDGSLTTEELEVNVMSSQGKRRRLIENNIPLRALAEFAAQNEGVFVEGHNSDDFTSNIAPVHPTMIEVQLSALGAVDLQGEDFLSLDFKKLIAGRSYTVYAIESNVLNAPEYAYKRNTVPAEVRSREIDVTDLASLIIPAGGNLESLDISYGESDVEITLAELQYQQYKTNDLVKVGTRTATDEDLMVAVYGFGSYYVINVADAQRVNINLSSNAGMAFYTVGVVGLNSGQ